MEENQLAPFKTIIIGGSAGSLDILLKVLPFVDKLTVALVIVLHRKSSDDSLLEELIAKKSAFPVVEVEDKIGLSPGFIYVAPSDYHLLFEKNFLLSLDISEKVNFSRPSIDVSFESAAEVFGPMLTGILLSGANSDGTEGLKTIKNHGGITVVQDPETAEIPFMPNHARLHANPDFILDLDGLIELFQ